ncbi:AlbA family DNA-binding domain-containing protein [Rhodoflexus sp.]
MKLNQPDEFQQLIRSGESLTLEFKQTASNPEKIAKTLVAFANTLGGVLVIGISDQKEVIGIDPEEEKFSLQQAALSHCLPPIHITYTEVELEEKTVLLAEVAADSTPHYYTKGGTTGQQFYMRSGSRNQLIMKDR